MSNCSIGVFKRLQRYFCYYERLIGGLVSTVPGGTIQRNTNQGSISEGIGVVQAPPPKKIPSPPPPQTKYCYHYSIY